MGEFTSIVNTWIANRRTAQTIRNIERNNEMRRNITKYEPSDIEGFIERDQQVGSYIISGGVVRNRARTAASIVACSLIQNLPVVVLHEGDLELQNQVAMATAFTNNKVIVTQNTPIYDPFYNRSNQEICNLIISATNNSMSIAKTLELVEHSNNLIKIKKIDTVDIPVEVGDSGFGIYS